jgi:hypothetical protein
LETDHGKKRRAPFRRNQTKNLRWKQRKKMEYLAAAVHAKKGEEKMKHLSEDHRRKLSEAHTGKHLSEDHRRKLSEAITGEKHPLFGKHLPEETRRKMSEANTGEKHPNYGKHLPEETRRKLSEANTGEKNPLFGKPLSEDHRIKLLDAGRGIWYGNATEQPYCDLFNEEFKERVRAFYGYACVECGTPQNGRKLDVHHAHYDKRTCCKPGEAVGNRHFVALCKSCHGKTNSNRHYWEQHFTDMINNFYGGKSYFTKEEMEIVIKV